MNEKLSRILRYLKLIENLTKDQKQLLFAVASTPSAYCYSTAWQSALGLTSKTIERELPALITQNVVVKLPTAFGGLSLYAVNPPEISEMIKNLVRTQTKRAFAAFFIRAHTNSISTPKVITSSSYLREPKPETSNNTAESQTAPTRSFRNNVIRGPWGSFDAADYEREIEKMERIREAEREGRDLIDDDL